MVPRSVNQVLIEDSKDSSQGWVHRANWTRREIIPRIPQVHAVTVVFQETPSFLAGNQQKSPIMSCNKYPNWHLAFQICLILAGWWSWWSTGSWGRHNKSPEEIYLCNYSCQSHSCSNWKARRPLRVPSGCRMKETQKRSINQINQNLNRGLSTVCTWWWFLWDKCVGAII